MDLRRHLSDRRLSKLESSLDFRLTRAYFADALLYGRTQGTGRGVLAVLEVVKDLSRRCAVGN